VSLEGPWYVVINNQEYPEYGWQCIGDMLNSGMDVLNGLSVTGWLLFQVPANYGTFSLVWVDEHNEGLNAVPSNYNIQYVQQDESSNINAQYIQQSTTTGPDQIIMEAYNWQTPVSLILQLRNTGATTVNLATADFYLAGQGLTSGASNVSSCSNGSSATTMIPGGACTYTITVTGPTYAAGVAYVIRLALADGSVFSYSVVDGMSA